MKSMKLRPVLPLKAIDQMAFQFVKFICSVIFYVKASQNIDCRHTTLERSQFNEKLLFSSFLIRNAYILPT